MTQQFNANEKRYFRKMFQLYDTDKSGAIGLAELKNLCRHLGVDMSEESLLESVVSIGCPVENNEIDLDFNSFLKWLGSSASETGGDEFAALKVKITAQGSKALTNDQIQRFKEVFDHFDADHSGSIDADELMNVFSSMGNDVTREEMEQMIAGVDDDGSGEIEFEEFIMLMCTHYGHSFTSEMEEVFSHLDPDAFGRLPVTAVANMMRETTGGILSEAEISEIIASVAENGYVDYMKWESLWEACNEQ